MHTQSQMAARAHKPAEIPKTNFHLNTAPLGYIPQ